MSLPVVATKQNFTSVSGILAYDLPQAFTFCTSPSQLVVLINSVPVSSALYLFEVAVPRVTFLTQPLVGANIEFRTAIPLTQLLAYPRGGSFPSQASERGLDKLTVLLSQLQDTANFGVPGTPPAGITIPLLDARYFKLVDLPTDFNVPRQSQYQNANVLQNANFEYRIRTNITTRTLSLPDIDSRNYLVDRWYLSGDAATGDVQQQIVFDTVLNKSVLKINRTGNTSSSLRLGQFLEDADCRQFAGKQMTLTVKLATGIGYSGSTVGMNMTFSNTVVRAAPLITTNTFTNGVSISPTGGSYVTTSLTFTVPTDVRNMAMVLQIARVAATSGINDFVSISDVMLEEGAYFTGFRYPSLAVTTQQCKRYAESFYISIRGYTAAPITIGQAIIYQVPKYFPPAFVGDLFSELNSINVTGPVTFLTPQGNAGGSFNLLTVAAGGYILEGKVILLTCEP